MATAEASPSTLGPRYAPDDPSLPEPWKGLIDGSTGVLYYWNPETNVTQYEKPASLPPPLPPGPPPAASTPKMNPIPGSRTPQVQPDNAQTQQIQQNPVQQHQVSQFGLGMQQTHLGQDQIRPQMIQQPGQQMPSQFGHMPMQQPGQQGFPQSMRPGNQGPYQPMQPTPQGHMYPGAQHGFQFNPHQNQYSVHQQNMPPQGSSQQPQHLMQGQQLPHKQEHKMEQPAFSPAPHQYQQQGQPFPHPREQETAIPQRDDVEFQQIKQDLPVGSNSSHAPKMNIQTSQTMQQYGGSFGNMQQSNPSVQVQQMGQELTHPQNPQHGSRFQNQMGPPGMMHGQQQNLPTGGSKMGNEENHHARAGNDYFYNTNKDVNSMSPQLPKLAPLPMTRNQEMRIGDFPSQNVTPSHPGRLSGPGGPPLHNVYGHSSGPPPYPNNAFVRPPLQMMGPSDPSHLSAAEAYRQKHEVTATGEDVPAPYMTFEATGFPPELIQELHFAGFSAPTPIQAQTWPIALQNKDIVAIAKTGSGKTLGYLIPAFIHLRRRRNNSQNGPTVLVLSPTRELATQIQDEAIKFGRSSRVSCTCLYGGAPKGPQLKELERGADVVVATPGRLNDILEMKRIDFRQVSLLVLDEADRMLDMGFEPQIRKIVNEIPPRRQTLMYTATWPKEVRKIASDLLVNPVQVNIGNVDELAANKSITQYVEVVPEMEKQRRLEQILRTQERGSKAIIFCSTKKLCDHLTRSLGRNFGAAAIHGDKSQGERDWVLNQFRAGKSPILVATDVAARGLDVPDIRVVINYDFPTGIEDYVHRIGRTGRAGATGIAYTFFSEHDWKYAPDLVKLLEGANQIVPPEIRDIALRGGPSFGNNRGPMNRYDSGDSGGRWDSGNRGGGFGGGRGGGGMRDGGGRGGGRWDSGGFGGGRGGGMRDGGGFGGGRGGGMRDGGGFGGGRGGGMRDGGFGGGFGGGRGGGRGPHDRFNSLDSRGRGRGGRGRFGDRRDRSLSRSPERVRTWGYNRSRSRSHSLSRSRSRSRGRSYSRSRSRSRSWSRSRSPRRSRSRSRSRTPRRSRSRSYERRPPRKSKFDQIDVVPAVAPNNVKVVPPIESGGNGFSGNVGPTEQIPPSVANVDAGLDPNNPPSSES